MRVKLEGNEREAEGFCGESQREYEKVREMKRMKKEMVGNHWRKKDEEAGTYLMTKLHVVQASPLNYVQFSNNNNIQISPESSQESKNAMHPKMTEMPSIGKEHKDSKKHPQWIESVTPQPSCIINFMGLYACYYLSYSKCIKL